MERPILFSAPMVRAILDGRKTQTRRVVKPIPQMVTDKSIVTWDGDAAALMRLFDQVGRSCPYGQSGDRLWVRETFRTEESYDHIKPSDIPVASAGHTLAVPFWYAADLSGADFQHMPPGLRPGKSRPGMFMPRAASRILLEITAVRVERLQDISDADLEAEGIQEWIDRGIDHDGYPRDAFRSLWESINGPCSWKSNPWVWVVEFKRVDAHHVARRDA